MNVWNYIIKTGLLLVLAAASFADLKKLSLNINFLCIAFTCGFALQTASGELSVWEMLAGAASGAVFALISKFSRQAIGYGDSFLISVSGAWLGFFDNLMLLMCTFLALAAFGILAVALKKAGTNSALPFAPFMLAGYTAVLGLWL